MRNKITDEVFSSAVKEMFPEEKVSKVAFDVNMAASALLGYSAGNVAGKTIGKSTAENRILKDSLRKSDIPSLEGDYYSQVENMYKNMNVMFTPISAVYMLKNKGKNVTIDVVEKSEMNDKMMEAYKNQDGEYFKNLMINKVYLDVQNAESIFIKKMLDANKSLSSSIDKKASEENDDIFNDLKNIHIIKRVVENNPESEITRYFSKIASEESIIKVPVELERPIKAYSELGNLQLDFFKIAKSSKDDVLQMKLLNKKYVNKKVKIGFLANRVTFMVDDIVVAQLHSISMDEEGYKAFKNKDTKYFKNVFIKETDDSELIKKASEILEIKDIFFNSLIHPKIYYIVLNSKFGNDWISYDPEALIKVIETEFGLLEPICSRALDKILSIQNICAGVDCLVNPFVFEKMARAINHKPISFKEWEYNLTPGEIVNALQIIDELTPTNDIFDDLSEKVVSYISNAFVLGECRAIIPNNNIISSELEGRFFEILNSDINQRWSSLNVSEIVYQRHIQPLASYVTKVVRSQGDYSSEAIDKALNTALTKSKTKDERVVNLSRQTAIINLSIDLMLNEVDSELKSMRELLNI